MIDDTMDRVRALVRKGKSAPTAVVDQQLIALIEHVFCERLPFPRRVETNAEDPNNTEANKSSTRASGGGGEGGYDLWEKAVRSPDPKFKKDTQRRVLQQLKDLLQTYLVACIVRVRFFPCKIVRKKNIEDAMIVSILACPGKH